MTSKQTIPIETVHLFPILDRMLIDLLKSLTAAVWNAATIAKLWSVKDIASHLLDGNLRALSTSRDHYFGETPSKVNSYIDLVSYLNQLNATWVNATKRMSPQVLIELLESTGAQYSAHLQTLDPFSKAVFSVAWAGQNESENWFHIAREYTEKWLHQQQIRDALAKQTLLTKELFYPFIDTLMCGLPHTYRHVAADAGTMVTVNILTDIGGQWNLIKASDHWELTKEKFSKPKVVVNIDPNDAWKLFSKGITKEEVIDKVEIIGDRKLGEVCLQMLSVMA